MYYPSFLSYILCRFSHCLLQIILSKFSFVRKLICYYYIYIILGLFFCFVFVFVCLFFFFFLILLAFAFSPLSSYRPACSVSVCVHVFFCSYIVCILVVWLLVITNCVIKRKKSFQNHGAISVSLGLLLADSFVILFTIFIAIVYA